MNALAAFAAYRLRRAARGDLMQPYLEGKTMKLSSIPVVAGLLLAAFALAWSGASHADIIPSFGFTITVDHVTSDASTGVVDDDDGDGYCSLREAFIAANNLADYHECTVEVTGGSGLTVVLPTGATFTLNDGPYTSASDPQGPNGLPVVPAGTGFEIAGNGATIARASAAETPRFRLLQVEGAVDMSHLTLLHGWATGNVSNRGGCLYNPYGATTTLDHVKIAHCNVASDSIGANGGHGGGIYNVGTLTMTHSEVSDNLTGHATESGGSGFGGYGAGIFNWGTVSISGNSVVSGNRVGGLSGAGGGIYNQGDLTITDSTITDNDANLDNDTNDQAHRGGGIANTDTLTLTDSTVSANNARFGGGIAAYGSASETTVQGTAIIGNQAYDGGGIMVIAGVSTTITGSTLTGNSAIHDGGALALNSGATTVANTTISGNAAPIAGSGIYLSSLSASASLILSYATVTGNGRDGIYMPIGSVTLDHSVITGEQQACDAGTTSAIFTSAGYNLDDDNSCGLTQTGDQSGVDPQLAALADNGGSTQTLQPMPGSPVIDAIPAADCTTNVSTGVDASVDQRGVARPQNDGCDIGAVEVQPYVTTFVSFGGTGQHALAGDPFAWPLSVQAKDADGNAIVGLNLAITAPTSGASASCTPTTTDGTGVLLAYCVANMQTGSYTVDFGYPAWRSPSGTSPSLSFTLTNDLNDRIFGDGFDGSALATASMVAGQSVADIAVTVPPNLLAGRIVPILVVHDAHGHRVTIVEARRSSDGIRVRTIDYDARGYPAHFGVWHLPASPHLQLHVERHDGVAQTSLQPSPR